jgi:D-alanine-D-alanine ligase
MKIAVIYNRESLRVINLLGMRNREKYRIEAIKRITDALKASGHQVKTLEGDKDLIDNLEKYMPAVVKGERPGMALNLAYGIQGQARYTHIPGILEMLGIPYVGSGPLAHSLSLDKVVAKVLFRQNGLPTPDFAVLEGPTFEAPDLPYPLIVKPRSEADSFGLTVVHSEDELREATMRVFEEFEQPVLVERYIDGREINIGLVGNPPEAFPPVELDFGDGPRVYSNDDKGGRSGRTVHYLCPADLDEETVARAQEIARRAFSTLGCYDCARVDMRLDPEGNLYLLEMNSLPSLGYRGSYVVGAQNAGLDFPALLNRLFEAASVRYFGTSFIPPTTAKDATPREAALAFLTSNRDKLERRVEELVSFSSRISDPIGIRELVKHLDKRYRDLGLLPVKDLTDEHVIRTWETTEGMDDGTLLIAQLDSLLDADAPFQAFRRDAEWLHGEAVGVSRAPLAMLEYTLRALRSMKKLRRLRIGVLLYSDEGHDCRYSRDRIMRACGRVRRVIVLRPGTPSGKIVVGRRGLRKFRLLVEGKPSDLRRTSKVPEVLRWTSKQIEAMVGLSSRKDRLEIFPAEVESKRFPRLLPHRVMATILVTYPDSEAADGLEERIRALLGKGGPKWQLNIVSDRPPMPERKRNKKLLKEVEAAAEEWEVPLGNETSVSPSVAGLVPDGTAVLCGLGPVVREPYTPHEAIQRISLFQRTLLLTGVLHGAP